MSSDTHFSQIGGLKCRFVWDGLVFVPLSAKLGIKELEGTKGGGITRCKKKEHC